MGLPVVQLSGQGWGGSWGAAAWMGPGSCQQARQLPGVCLPQFPPLHSEDPPRVSEDRGHRSWYSVDRHHAQAFLRSVP